MESGECKGSAGAKFALHDILLDDLYNYPGSLGLHHLTTPVIEISSDGRTAQGMWYSLGLNVHQMPDGKKIPIIQPGRYNHNFVKEAGEWKYLEFRWQVIFRSSLYKGWVKEPIVGGKSMENEKLQKTASHHPYSPDERYNFPPLPPV